MYIEPSTNIRILKGVPLDPSYEHTIYFDSTTAQSDYFKSKTKYNLSNYTYQRVKRGYARIGLPADQVYDCNYMMFQNTGFGTKWFYAFITSVEYVNNQCTEITFEIDDMQTWFFDYTLGVNYVVREHSETDEIGDNLNDEPVELGEYVADDFMGTTKMGAKSIVLASVGIDTLFPFKGTIYSGVYSGVHFAVYPNTQQGAMDLSNLLDNITTQLLHDRIVAIFTIPTCFVGNELEPAKSYDIVCSKSVTSIGDYVPRNKKLFTYPYNFLEVDNLQGQQTIYPYEYFADEHDCEFLLTGNFSINGEAMYVPMNYKGVPANYNESMTMSTTTQCPFNVTSFIEGVANNSVSTAVSVLSAQDKLTRARTTGNLINIGTAGQVVSAGLNIASSVLHSSNYHGVSSSSLQLSLGIIDFASMHKHIQPQFAERIDCFFDKYGYATNTLKVPNRTVRPHWNYVQLKSCTLENNMIPTDAEKHICSIYEKGVTFWKNGGEVGDYSLDNSI